MPCRDYDDSLLRRNDMLARIACISMTKLEEEMDNDIFIQFLENNQELDIWWKAHKIADADAAEERITKKFKAAWQADGDKFTISEMKKYLEAESK
jgi:hypothetical protein